MGYPSPTGSHGLLVYVQHSTMCTPALLMLGRATDSCRVSLWEATRCTSCSACAKLCKETAGAHGYNACLCMGPAGEGRPVSKEERTMMSQQKGSTSSLENLLWRSVCNPLLPLHTQAQRIIFPLPPRLRDFVAPSGSRNLLLGGIMYV